MTRIAIIGASKGCGLETLKAALALGWNVSAVARNPDQAGMTHPNVAWYKGDARNELLIEQALQGCNAVAVTLSGPVGSNKPVTIFSEAMQTILTVMNRLGIKRLVFLSGLGAGDTKGKGGFLYSLFHSLMLKRNYEDKERAEALIMKSHKDWTILRPGRLTKGKRRGKISVIVNPAEYRGGSISRADVGHYLCACIKDGLNMHQLPVLVY
jgi:uncharacterized protein YbjT (DUF2867 family)